MLMGVVGLGFAILASMLQVVVVVFMAKVRLGQVRSGQVRFTYKEGQKNVHRRSAGLRFVDE
jgi:mannose/fructose/N-acetylgalactosamine-specific phosphotransferase system component IID